MSRAHSTYAPVPNLDNAIHIGTMTLFAHDIEYSTYEPYGKRVNTGVQFKGDPRYTDHEFDGFTGFNYMKGRFQLPNIGKFNRPDPQRDWNWMQPHTINLYEYVGNDPILNWDPTGFATWGLGLEVKGGAAIFAGDADASVVFDDSGNAALSFSWTGSKGLAVPILKGTPAFLVGFKLQATDGDDVEVLDGKAETESLMLAAGDGVAGDHIKGDGYEGGAVNFGVGIGASATMGDTDTKILFKSNIYESLPEEVKEIGMDFFEVTDEIGSKLADVLYDWLDEG